MQTLSNISFKSRNSLVKDAGLVCRKVRTAFPYVSHAKAAHEASPEILKNKDIVNFILKREKTLKEYREDQRHIQKPFNRYKEILYCTIKEKLAACYDLSVLTELVLRLNGIKNCTKVSLTNAEGKLLNHSAVIVKTSNNPKKNIIIDPWLQDCGLESEMLTKYKSIYAKYFRKLSPNDKIELTLRPQEKLSQEEINYFKEKYPQLIINKELFTKA